MNVIFEILPCVARDSVPFLGVHKILVLLRSLVWSMLLWLEVPR